MNQALIPVRLESGVVVMHTREEYERLWQGVDREACEAMAAPVEGHQQREEQE